MDRLEQLKIDFADDINQRCMVIEDLYELINLLLKENDSLYKQLEENSNLGDPNDIIEEKLPGYFKEDLEA